jgi:ABC-type lipoprotein export system ATPase subunit
MNADAIMIHTKDLEYTYGKEKVLAFENISVANGDQKILKGHSGAGKTTLIHMMAGILTPSRGSININSISINELSRVQADTFRAKNIGMIFQRNLFIRSVNMLQNVLLAHQLVNNRPDKTYIEMLFSKLGVASLAGKKPDSLSQGEQQRFSIARALVNRPQIILADEPTSSLDDENCSRFIELISTLCQEYKVTLLIATHDSRLEQHFSNITRLN